jgi:hypothetical protein
MLVGDWHLSDNGAHISHGRRLLGFYEIPCHHGEEALSQRRLFVILRSGVFFHEFSVFFLNTHIFNIFCSSVSKSIYCTHSVTNLSLLESFFIFSMISRTRIFSPPLK